MAQDRSLFTDPGAYGGAVPQARAPDPAPVSEALGRLAGTAAQVTLAFFNAEQSKLVLDAELLIGEQFTELETSLSQTGTIAEAESMFKERSAEIQADALKLAAPEGGQAFPATVSRIEEVFRRTSVRASANSKRDVFARQTKGYLVGLQRVRDSLSARALSEGTDQAAEEAKQAYAVRLVEAVETGFIKDENAASALAKFESELDYDRAALILTNDPATAYGMLMRLDPESGEAANFQDMDGNQRRSLVVQSLREMGNGEREADTGLKAAQDQAAKNLWEIHLSKGEIDPDTNAVSQGLTREELDARKDDLRLSDYKQFVKVVLASGNESQGSPDFNFWLDMVYDPNSNRDSVRTGLVRANAEGRLTNADARAFSNTNEEFAATGGKASLDPHNSAIKHIKDSLGLNFPSLRETERLRRAGAVQIYKLWAERNPNATLVDTFDMADGIIDRATIINFRETTVGLILPQGIDADRDAITIRDLVIRNTILRSNQASPIASLHLSDDEFSRQQDLLADWMRAVNNRDKSRGRKK